MRPVLSTLLWPLAVAFRLGLEGLIWFWPNIGSGRRVFPESIRRLIERATTVEVHYAELDSESSLPSEQLGTPMGFRSLGMVRLGSERVRQGVIRSILKANGECLGGFMCLDAEYALRLESELGRAELMICFWCMQVWVETGAEATGQWYPISRRPQRLLDSLLRAGGVPQPAPREETHSDLAI
jgi:hypothetical protein